MSSTPTIELDLGIRYTVFKPIDDHGSPEEYLLRVKGEIIGSYIADDEDTPREITLGDLSLLIVQYGNAINDGVTLYEIFDLEDGLINTATQIYTADFQDFEPVIQESYSYATPDSDFLYIEDLFVHPLARGQHLGAIAVRAAVKDWQSSCNFIAINPNPQPLNDGAKLDEATRKLRAHFQLAGFKSIPGITPLLVCPALIQTTVDLPNTIHLSEESLSAID